MRIFDELKGEKYDKLTASYEKYLPQYFGKLGEAYKEYSEALDNEEYKIYVYYNKWPIRKLEYSFVIDKMKEAIFPGAAVLDAGCGVSSMPFLWAEFGGAVTAVDFDEKSIALMNKFNESAYFGDGKQISTNVCDIMKLPYMDNTFDVVTTTSVIEHLPYPNYLLAISELYRVLKVGGTLVCTCDLKADDTPKRRAVGAFSVSDIKKILMEFDGELVEEDLSLQELSITEKQIEEFWLQHYYDGIGYEGNREYVAIGFSIKKKASENKLPRLLKYDEIITELIQYESLVAEKEEQLRKVNEYADKKEQENEILVDNLNKVTAESRQRLDKINRITEENQQLKSDIEKLHKESLQLKSDVEKLYKENQQCIAELEKADKESALRLEALNKVTAESEERLKAIKFLKKELEKQCETEQE